MTRTAWTEAEFLASLNLHVRRLRDGSYTITDPTGEGFYWSAGCRKTHKKNKPMKLTFANAEKMHRWVMAETHSGDRLDQERDWY